MAFCAPTAAAAPHASPAPHLTSSCKHTFFSSCSKVGGSGSGGGNRTAWLSSAAPRVHALAAAATAEGAAFPAPNADYLAAEFAGHGVSFEAVGGSCVVKMAVRNGSAAHLLLPSGLVTSYKPAMWHGASTEVLHTTVSEGAGGRAVIRGGVSADFRCARGGGGGGENGDALTPSTSWSPSGSWSLRDVRGGPTGSIEVELVSVEPGNAAEARCVVTLRPEALASEFTVANGAASSPMRLSSAVSNHLRVSTPDATYAVGLQGSDYRSTDPILSEFTIVPPETATMASELLWLNQGLDMVLSGAARPPEPDGEEDDDYKHLTAELSRIYSHAPREFTVIDRGRRNSICLSRRGFEELYIFSPGSQHEWYGKYAYVCVGPAMLEPAVLGPGDTWHGAQLLRNPNL